MAEMCKKCGINAIGCLCMANTEYKFRRKVSCWPMKSWSMGVLPEQIKEAQAQHAKDGVPTEYTSEGEAIFTDAAHRRRFCERYGYYDRNGGYSSARQGEYKRKYGDN